MNIEINPVIPADDPRVQVAIAILHAEGRLLMQLRDPDPTIFYPGHWGLFGGHIEPGESPEIAVEREVLEEIGYQLPVVQKFGCYADEKAIRHVFQAPLKVSLTELVLTEGWDMGFLTPEDIHRCNGLSDRTQQVHPIGAIHQRILLDFIEQHF